MVVTAFILGVQWDLLPGLIEQAFARRFPV
jgi:hypothetical protein